MLPIAHECTEHTADNTETCALLHGTVFVNTLMTNMCAKSDCWMIEAHC